MWNLPPDAELQGRLLRVIGQMDLSTCYGCRECALRCGEGVQMTREEYGAVRRFIDESPDRDSIQAVLAQDKAVDLGDGVAVRMCRYFDMATRGCSVYPARPLVCRLLGHVEWLPCPIEKVERIVDTADAVDLMREYAASPRRTFEEWDSE